MTMPTILALCIALPLAGGAALGLVPRSAERLARAIAIAISGVVLVFASVLWYSFEPGVSWMQFETLREWLPGIGTGLHLGVDGLSMPLVFLTALLTLLAVIASKSIKDQPRQYFTLILLLEAGLVGVFVALDLILFYVFWEVVLIPMFFLINVWGGPNRVYASVKFFVYTLAGSLAMLGGLITLYLTTGAHTFDMIEVGSAASALPVALQTGIFLAVAFAMAIKVPIVPFHTWLPDAHVEAPTAVSVLLAGVLLKMGSYGFLRFGPQLLPQGFKAVAPALAVLAVISIVFGAAVALVQTDLKKIVAYSSVSHMGYVMLGIASGTAAGMIGANVQMFSHGLIAGMAFLLVGAFYERAHTREISAFGGVAKVAPILSGTLVLMAFASLGLPGMSGFVGEFLVVLGAFKVSVWQAAVAASAVVLTAGYLLWMVRRVAFGELNPERASMPDMTLTEAAAIMPLCAATLLIGFFPQTLVGVISASAEYLVKLIGG
jgi:NADH-quinone oxidoreductase subunit M